jgi:hypothetical protein
MLLCGVVSMPLACRGPTPPAPDAPVTKQEVGEAMVSVHAHARWPDKNFGGADFIPLGRAIQTLANETGRRPGAGSRARRAVAKLSSYSYGEFEPEVATLLANYDVGSALLKDEIVRAAAKATPPIPLPPTPDRMAELEAIIVDLPLLMMLPPADCRAKAPKYVGGVGKPPPVKWAYDQFIPRRMDDIARALDPQSWSEASDYFYRSYLVDAPSCCPPKGPGCPFKAKPPSDPYPGDPEEGPERPRGKPYGTTAFFELFCIGKHCPDCEGDSKKCLAAFKNILCVDTRYVPGVTFSVFTSCADQYEVGYSLGGYLYGELNGAENQKINADGGTLSVRPATDLERQQNGLVGPDWSLVHVDKHLAFEGSLGGSAGYVLQAYEDELAGQIVEQACTEIAPECWIAW